jgi:hypothetical protein
MLIKSIWFVTTILLASVCAAPSEKPASPDLRIERFEAVPDCIFPDPDRGLLAYRVTDAVHITVSALHRGGRVRPFHTQANPTPTTLAASNVVDRGVTADVEGYRLVARAADRCEVTRDLPFRYRVARFQPIPPARHLRDTSGRDFFARYESDARLDHVDSMTCSFRFDAPIAGESGRTGTARFSGSGSSAIVFCEIAWRSRRKAQAGGTVEWIARVNDQCTQGRIVRTARINPIP